MNNMVTAILSLTVALGLGAINITLMSISKTLIAILKAMP